MSAEVTLLEVRSEAGDFMLAIKGRPARAIQSSSTTTVQLTAAASGGWILSVGESVTTGPTLVTKPFLFEQTNYQLEVVAPDSLDPSSCQLRLGGRELGRPRKITGHLLWLCALNFYSEVGFADLTLAVGSRTLLHLRVEVFPSKLDYRTDYRSLQADIQTEVRSLVFAALGRTSQRGATRVGAQETEIEWLTVLHQDFERLRRAMDIILRQPMRHLHREREIVRGDRAHRADKASLAYLRTNPQSLHSSDLGPIKVHGRSWGAVKLAVTRKTLTVDTVENRYVAVALRLLLHRVRRDLRQFEGARDGDAFSRWVGFLKGVERATRRWLDATFLAELPREMAMPRPTLALHLTPGYREFFSAHANLSRSLDLQGDALDLQQKDLATLYELWCFIALANLLRDGLGLAPRRPSWLRVEQRRTVLELKKGKTSAIEWKTSDGQDVRIVYNIEDDTPTGTYKPDNTLVVSKKHGVEPFLYVFDAKYRLASDADYVKTHGAPGPPVDTINRMHAYRDQIVRAPKANAPPSPSSTVWGLGHRRYLQQTVSAVVLYPYAAADATKNRFVGTIEQVGIGGLPFLPTRNEEVARLLRRIIDTSAEATEDSAVEFAPVRSRSEVEKAHSHGLLVDLHGPALRDYVEKHRVHPVPYRDGHPLRLRADFLVLFHATGAPGQPWFSLAHAAVKGIRVGPRSQIVPPPPPDGGSDTDLYLWFELADLTPMPEPLSWDGAPPTLGFTTRLALESARSGRELLLIREPERRFVDECRRRGWPVRVMERGAVKPFNLFDLAELRLRFEVAFPAEAIEGEAPTVGVTFDPMTGTFWSDDGFELFSWPELMTQPGLSLARLSPLPRTDDEPATPGPAATTR